MPEPLIFTPNERPKTLDVIGENLTILASAGQTAGYELFYQDGQVGHGPRPHHHAWDEAFFVIKGQIDFGVGDKELTTPPGTLVHIASGSMHWFRFVEDGEMLSITGPGSDAALFFPKSVRPPPVPTIWRISSRRAQTTKCCPRRKAPTEDSAS